MIFSGKRGGGAERSCKRMYEILTPLVSKYPVTVLNASVHSVDVPICFDSVVIGMTQYSDDCMAGHAGRSKNTRSNCNTGRQSQFWNFRVNGLQNMGVANVPPIKHQIVVTNRSDGARGFRNLNDLVMRLSEIYGEENVLMIEWSEISIQEQLEIISSTTVHLTPPGGVSFISFFLPRWATSIRLYSSDWLLEWNFFNYLGYMHPEHVNCPGGNINITNVEQLVEDSIHRYDTMSGTKIPIARK